MTFGNSANEAFETATGTDRTGPPKAASSKYSGRNLRLSTSFGKNRKNAEEQITKVSTVPHPTAVCTVWI
jgi:hypothetical protein